MRSTKKARTAAACLGALLVGYGIASAQTRRHVARSCPRPELRVFKSRGALQLVCGGEVTETFGATFGANPVGPKLREGDERTPEGVYTVTSRVRSARFHRFLGLSYPNADDLRRARELGITRPGGGIGIHGTTARLSGLARAWIRISRGAGVSSAWGPTDGCIGVANEDVETLYELVPVGTRVVIGP